MSNLASRIRAAIPCDPLTFRIRQRIQKALDNSASRA